MIHSISYSIKHKVKKKNSILCIMLLNNTYILYYIILIVYLKIKCLTWVTLCKNLTSGFAYAHVEIVIV